MIGLDQALAELPDAKKKASDGLRRYRQSQAWWDDLSRYISSVRDDQGDQLKSIWTTYAAQVVELIIFDVVTTGYQDFFESNLPRHPEANYQMTATTKRRLMDGIMSMIKRGRAAR